MSSDQEATFWQNRYLNQQTGWDIGYPSTPLKTYFDQLTDKSIRILIPGAGNSYEAEYLWQAGFENVYVLDIAEAPLQALQNRVPDFPTEQLIQGDFFEHDGQYDLIVEQTFFCSFYPAPTTRQAYAEQMSKLLVPGGKLVGLWFDIPLTMAEDKRPYGGDRDIYLSYLNPHFTVKTFESCYNSIAPRQGNELFGVFIK